MAEAEHTDAVEETPAAEEPTADEQAEALEQELDELGQTKRERDEYLELAQRTRADFENYRKRAAKEAEQAALRGKADLAAGLIPAIDNLERALATAAADDPMAKGIELVLKDLSEALERAGVESYDPAGERFDPEWHEALQTRPADGGEPGTVVETLEKGYRLNGQVLRAARVVVSE
jgi:molecular chaperone GrpE